MTEKFMKLVCVIVADGLRKKVTDNFHINFQKYRFVEDLGCDRVAMLRVSIALAGRFQINMYGENLDDIRTVHQMAVLVQNKLVAAGRFREFA